MKENVILALTLLGFLTVSNAQVTFNPIVRGGLNVSTLVQTESEAKIEYYLGTGAALNLTKRYTLQPEIGISRQGAKNLRYTTYNYNYNYYYNVETDVVESFSATYLSLSLLNKFNLGPGRVSILFGPSTDFRVTDFKNSSSNDVDIALNLGVMVKVTDNLSIETRFKKGFIEPYDFSEELFFEDIFFPFFQDKTYFVFQMGAVYAFDLTKKNKD